MNEYEKLDAALYYFSNSMQTKLHKKYDQGRRGWSSRKCRDFILLELLRHANELHSGDASQIVDVANFAMMLWWQEIHPSTRKKMMNKYHKRHGESG